MSEAGSVIVKIVANDQELKTVLAQDVAALKGFAAAGGEAGRQLGQELDAGVRKFRPGTQEAIDQVARLGLTVIENTGKVSWGFTHASDAATLLAHSTAGVATLAGPTFSQMAVAAERARDSLTATVLAARQAADGVEGVGEASESLPELGQRTEQAREVLMGMRAEIDKLLPSLQGVGEGAVVFKTLQQGIDESLGIVSRDINSARESASVFAKDFKATATSVEQDMTKLGQTSTQMSARVGVSFRTLQQNIDASMGLIDRPLNSAAASARVFEQSFLGSTPVVEEVGQALQDTGRHMDRTGQSSSHLRTEINGAASAAANLGNILGAGEYLQVPSQLAHIAGGFAHISLTMLAGVGAAFAFVGAITYIVMEAEKARAAVAEIKLGADIAGNVSVASENVEYLIEQINELSWASAEDTRVAVEAFARLQFMTEQNLIGMSSATARWAATTNTSMEDVGKRFIGLLEKESVSAKDLFDVFGDLTLAQQQNFQAAKASGDQHAVVAAILEIVAEKTDRFEESTLKAKTTFWQSILAMDEAGPTIGMLTELIDKNRAVFDALGRSARNAAAGLDVYIDKANEAIAMGQRVADGISTPIESIEKLYEQEATLLAGIEEAKKTKTGEELAVYMRGVADDLEKVQKDIKTAQKAPIDEEYADFKRNEELKVSRAKDTAKANIQSLRETLDFAKRAYGEGSKDAIEAETRLNNALKAADAAAASGKGASGAGRFDISETKQRISEINANEALGIEERGRMIRAEYESLLANGKLTAQQRVQIQTEMNNALAANARQGSAERREIEKDDLSTNLGLAQIRMRSERDVMQIAVGEKRATNAQKLELDLKFAAEEGAIQLEILNKEQESLREGSAEFRSIENDKLLAKAETAAEIARINAQIAANERKVARDAGSAWTSAADSITAAERSMLGDMFSGRVTFMQALGRATAQFLQRELEDTLIYFTKKMLLSETEFAFEEAKISKGVLLHLLGEGEKTGAVLAGAATRTMAGTIESAASVATTAPPVIAHVVGEGAKTAATVAGAAIRTGAETVAASTSLGVSAAMGSAQIMNDAKKAAAGAYSAVSEIPIIGPILAPIAAGAAFIAVMAFNTLTSGFKEGGYTGSGSRGDPVGVVHGQEFVSHADATARYRPLLEAMNAGADLSNVIMLAANNNNVLNKIDSADLTNAMTFNNNSAINQLAVGAWNVPHDMPAFIHKGESVVPKNFAEGLRERGGISNNNTSGNMTANLHYRPTINAPAHKSLEQLLSEDSRALKAWMRTEARNGFKPFGGG